MTYDRAQNGWNRDWETDNVPDAENELDYYKQRLHIAEAKLREFGIVWSDESSAYVFNGKD